MFYSASSESENNYIPLESTKKAKGRNLDHGILKQRGKGKTKGKGLVATLVVLSRTCNFEVYVILCLYFGSN